jgi:hypothetical protein
VRKRDGGCDVADADVAVVAAGGRVRGEGKASLLETWVEEKEKDPADLKMEG